jgi:hypothetical protein
VNFPSWTSWVRRAPRVDDSTPTRPNRTVGDCCSSRIDHSWQQVRRSRLQTRYHRTVVCSFLTLVKMDARRLIGCARCWRRMAAKRGWTPETFAGERLGAKKSSGAEQLRRAGRGTHSGFLCFGDLPGRADVGSRRRQAGDPGAGRCRCACSHSPEEQELPPVSPSSRPIWFSMSLPRPAAESTTARPLRYDTVPNLPQNYLVRSDRLAALRDLLHRRLRGEYRGDGRGGNGRHWQEGARYRVMPRLGGATGVSR